MKRIIGILLIIAFCFSLSLAEEEKGKIKILDVLTIDLVIKGGLTWTPFEPDLKASGAISPCYFDFKLKNEYKINIDYVMKKERVLQNGEYKDVFDFENGNIGIGMPLDTPFKLIDEVASLFGGKINYSYASFLSLFKLGIGYNFKSGKMELNGFLIDLNVPIF